jgi:hypothetical protein
MKNLIALTIVTLLVGCSENQPSSTGSNLPPVTGSNGQVYMKAKAEFDLSSSPDGSAQFNLVKKTYAAAPNCVHGQCTDFSDITVTNNGSTQFALTNHNPIIQGTDNQNITVLGNLKIGTLFDNNLTSCGGQKCTAAAIRIYTTDNGGQVLGAGLWSQSIGQSVTLSVSGGSSNSTLAAIPYNPTDGSSLQIDLEPIDISKNVIELSGDFLDAGPTAQGYTLSANFTQAGSGIYQAHVVVEYDLIGTTIATGDPASISVDSSMVPNPLPLNECVGPLTIFFLNSSGNPVNAAQKMFLDLNDPNPDVDFNVTNYLDHAVAHVEAFSDLNCSSPIDDQEVGNFGYQALAGVSTAQFWVKGLVSESTAQLIVTAHEFGSHPNLPSTINFHPSFSTGTLAWNIPANYTLVGNSHQVWIPFTGGVGSSFGAASSDGNLVELEVFNGMQMAFIQEVAPVYADVPFTITIEQLSPFAQSSSAITIVPGPMGLSPDPTNDLANSVAPQSTTHFNFTGGYAPFIASVNPDNSSSIMNVQATPNPNDSSPYASSWGFDYKSGSISNTPDTITVTDAHNQTATFSLNIQDPCVNNPGSNQCCNFNPGDPSCNFGF